MLAFLTHKLHPMEKLGQYSVDLFKGNVLAHASRTFRFFHLVNTFTAKYRITVSTLNRVFDYAEADGALKFFLPFANGRLRIDFRDNGLF